MNKYEKIYQKFIEDARKGKRQSPLKAVRCFCTSCMGWQASEINDCCGNEDIGCPLFWFRFGKNKTGKESRRERKATTP